MDYRFNFMNTKIHIDDESTICIVKNPVYHLRTKHIEIRHHFIRGCYEKRLVDVIKIHTDANVADLLTKGFDVTRFNFLVLVLVVRINTDKDKHEFEDGWKLCCLQVNSGGLQVNTELKMANLRYSDKHNMVAFLKKPTESVGFTEIVDFLKGTSLRYALSHNPTIYDSLVKQLWQTTTLRTLANGIQELVASIDNKEFTITEESIRSQLQLADATCITNLPDAKIYEGLATLGYVSEGKLTFWKKNFTPQWKFIIHNILHCISPKSGGWDQFGSTIATALICLSSNRVYNFSKMIFDGMVHNLESNTKFLMYPRFLQIILDITTENNGKYLALTLTKKIFGNMKRGFAGEHVPLLPAMLAGAAPDQGEGSAIPAGSQPTPDPGTEIPQSQGPTVTPVADEATTTGVGVETEGATTTPSGLDAGMDSGNIHESPLRSHEAPFPKGNTSGSAEDSLNLKELMDIVPKLVLRIDHLEKELHQTKSTYGKAVLTLVERVKLLEAALKRKSRKVILSESEDEEQEDQGRKIQDIDDDPLVSLVRNSMEEKEADFVTPKKVSASGEAQEEDISPTTLEATKTLSKVASQNVSTYKRRARSASKGEDIGIGMDFFSAAKERLNSAEVEVNTEVNPGSAGVNTSNTPVSMPSVIQTVNVIVPSLVKSQREGKAPMTLEDVQATQKTKEQIRQEEASLAEAMRLQALQDEENARQVHLDALLAKRIQEEQELSEQQQKRKVEVQEAAQFYTEEDWDTIRAKLESNAELTKSLQGENVSSDDFSKRMVDMINQKISIMQNRRLSSWKMAQLKKLTFEELKVEFEKLMRSIESLMPMGYEERVKRAGVQLEQESSKKPKIAVKDVPVIEEKVKVVKERKEPNKREQERRKKQKLGNAMLKSISRDDLTELYMLVMQKYGTNGPEDEYERVFWGDLKTMFDPPLSTDPMEITIVNKDA
ncbi:hypothetical protein Tco_1403771 [Tanacetum coccineum]